MAQDAIKISTRAILALVQAKKLRKAAHELKKLEPKRKQIYGYDRLVGAVHSPLTKAEKFFFEARALVPSLVDDSEEGDPGTRGNRTRAAIRLLMKSRLIVRDDPQINDLLKKCLAVIQEAESKISQAQGHAVRGNWAAAYKDIKHAAALDDTPEARETKKFIAQQYQAHTREEKSLGTVMTIGKIGAALLVATFIGLLIYTVALHNERESAWKRAEKEKAAFLKSAAKAAPPPLPAEPAAETPVKTAAPGIASAAAAPGDPAAPAAPVAQVPNQAPVEKPVEINSEAELGTSLGNLEVGTKITLRYQSGAWRAWIRASGFSPDAPSEGGKVHSLSIRGMRAGGETKVLAVVPYHTKETPFTYEVIGKYDAVILRINEDPGALGNNDGVVTYGVLVTPPAK